MKIDKSIANIYLRMQKDCSNESYSSTLKICKLMTKPFILLNNFKSEINSTLDNNIKIHSLNGLLYLVSKNYYEFDNYYDFLYNMLKQYILGKNKQLFDCKSTFTLLKILEISLRTSKLSRRYLKIFVKTLLQISLTTKMNISIWISFLIFNLLKKHKELRTLLKPNKQVLEESIKNNESLEVDFEIEDDIDFREVILLKHHYLQEIREIYSNLEINLEYMDFINLEEYNNLSFEKLFISKISNIASN